MATRAAKKYTYWLTEEGLSLIESWARKGLNDLEIMNNMRSVMGDTLNQDTFYTWKKKYPEFAEALKQGRFIAIAQVEDALFNSAMSGNTAAQIFYLKNRDRANWKDKFESDNNVQMQLNAEYDLADRILVKQREQMETDPEEDEEEYGEPASNDTE